jgi:hypothetical protein
MWNPSNGLLYSLGTSGPEDLGLLPQLRGSSGIQMGPGQGGEPGPESMGNLQEERSVSLWENMPQFSTPRYMLSGPVIMKFTRTLDHRNMLAFALTVRRL